ncbi:glutamine amidotransferase [Paraburkholderia bannensis]|uniref:glutamine amidotransferase n=1 Tax=Paraburkholderia bannensis TaxID=765414 RepID=UPI002AB79711|nr:glutamine amidotransferase [Paraburkholderia bannensis]
MPVPPLVIVQVGTPPDVIRHHLGDLPDWFCLALGRPRESVTIIRVFDGEPLPAPNAHQVAVITGSWSMVTDLHPWSEATAQWIRDAMAVGMPLFGVCYGHQLMAHALGGRVDYHPLGREVGCKTINLLPDAENDALLKDWPATFRAHLTHEQSIVELPPGAQVLAYSDHDRNQIVRYGPNAISTQFHPEFTPAISAACINRRAEVLRAEGRDPDAMLLALIETHEAAGLLRHFVETSICSPA